MPVIRLATHLAKRSLSWMLSSSIRLYLLPLGSSSSDLQHATQKRLMVIRHCTGAATSNAASRDAPTIHNDGTRWTYSQRLRWLFQNTKSTKFKRRPGDRLFCMASPAMQHLGNYPLGKPQVPSAEIICNDCSS